MKIIEGDCLKSKFTNDLANFCRKYGSQFGIFEGIDDGKYIVKSGYKIFELSKDEFESDWIID